MSQANVPHFSADDVLEFYALLHELALDVWLDGGWAVDALLGEQTRPHADIDIVIEHNHVSLLRHALEARGYKDVLRDDTRPINFVMSDTGREAGRIIDFHVIVLDDEGNGDYGDEKSAFPAWGLLGKGVIAGLPVRCLTPQLLVDFHQGYALRAKDIHDVTRLCRKFNLTLPAEYRRTHE